MQAGIRTLSVTSKVGESISGFSEWGPRFQKVTIGRTIPTLKKQEDAEAILRCGFLDIGTPIEYNLIQADAIRTTLRQRVLADPATDGWLDPYSLVSGHPSLGFVPPELFSTPNLAGLHALSAAGLGAEEAARIRLGLPSGGTDAIDWPKLKGTSLATDSEFWAGMARARVYPRLLGGLVEQGYRLRIALLAPPVPSLHEDWVKSPDLQFELNAAASQLLRIGETDAAPLRLLYSFHVHPSALRNPELLQRALEMLRLALAGTEYRFRGVHLSFIDLKAVTIDGAPTVRLAKDLASRVIEIAASSGRFTTVSDSGPVGPAFLDLGAAFATYGPSMSMNRTYQVVRSPAKPEANRIREAKFGKVLGGPYNYVLLRLRDVRAQNWTLESTNGKCGNEVPPGVRRGPDYRYRVEFSKPYNVAVQEVLNDLRDRELIKTKNARPGRSLLGRSDDSLIVPWA